MRASLCALGLATMLLCSPAWSAYPNNECRDPNILCVGSSDTAEYATIQAAIDDAVNGDEVVLCNLDDAYTGTGNGAIVFNSKDVTVRSLDPFDMTAGGIVERTVVAGPAPVFIFQPGDTAVVEGLTITGWNESVDGGGISCSGGTPTIRDCRIIDSGARRGGGVAITGTCAASIIRCTIENNKSKGTPGGESARGGGVFIEVDPGTVPQIVDCDIKGNGFVDYDAPGEAQRLGGGIYCKNSSPIVTRCDILNHDVRDTWGAGIAIDISQTGQSNARISDCTIAGNRVRTGRGGGIWCGADHMDPDPNANQPELINCQILGNTANLGGGIWAQGASPIIRSSIIAENIACVGILGDKGWGGGVYLSGTRAEFHETSIVANWAGDNSKTGPCSNPSGGGGGGVYITGSPPGLTPLLENCIVWHNSQNNDPLRAQIVLLPACPPLVEASSLDLFWSDLPAGDQGLFDHNNVVNDQNNTNGDPLFISAGPLVINSTDCPIIGVTGDYHLGTVNSAAYDTTSQFFVPGPGETDVDGDPRMLSVRVDMGADEINDCNLNGTPDAEDIASCGADPFCQDCNGNGVLDGCDVDPLDPDGNGQVTTDCNQNGIPDHGLPDIGECEPDCDRDGLPDECEFAGAACLVNANCPAGTDTDCNGDGIPDTCQAGDCNGNLINDLCDLDPNQGMSEDRNGNGLPDECEVIYVDADATSGANDGSSWTDAFTGFQDALEIGRGCDTVYIWVAQGTYTPDPTGLPDSREATFQLKSNVEIYGGFVGTETLRDQRNAVPEANGTVLSGDLAGDDIQFLNNGENSYHVVTGNNAADTAILDGFTITGGNADTWGAYRDSGGGMISRDGSPTLRNLQFFQNSAAARGGGLHNALDGPSGKWTTLSDCRFLRNRAVNTAGNAGDGGGMHNSGSFPDLTNCRFELNEAVGSGAGFFNETTVAGQKLTFTGCEFIDNSPVQGGTGLRGGGLFLGDSGYTAELTECTFRRNVALHGAGIYINSPSATLTLCKFVENTTLSGSFGRGGAAWVKIQTGNDGGGNAIAALNDVRFHNCLFGRNVAWRKGGGVYFDVDSAASSPVFVNCTIAHNFTLSALESGGGVFHHLATPDMTNCVLWGNGESCGESCDPLNDPTSPNCNCTVNELAQIRPYNLDNPRAVVTYSDWQGHTGGPGNINADPLFVDPNSNDTCLENDFFVRPGSPCIDVAKNAAVPLDTFDVNQDGNRDEQLPIDLFGTARFLDDLNTPDCPLGGCGTAPIVDMGAYELGAPVLIHGATGVSFSDHAFTGYIDPRAESDNGVDLNMGLDRFTLVFSEEVRTPGFATLMPASFQITETGAALPPSVLCIDECVIGTDCPNSVQGTVGWHVAMVRLSRIITVQQWTTVAVDVESMLGIPIDPCSHCLTVGFLPADVNQDGEVAPFDVLAFRQLVNEVTQPEQGVLEDFLDANRSGVVGVQDPFDLLRLRQLVNGVWPSTRVWNATTLAPFPACGGP